MRHGSLLCAAATWGFVLLKSLQEIEVTAGNLVHHLIVDCTKLLADPSLKVGVQDRSGVAAYAHN
jgi:hypothetical protein